MIPWLRSLFLPKERRAECKGLHQHSVEGIFLMNQMFSLVARSRAFWHRTASQSWGSEDTTSTSCLVLICRFLPGYTRPIDGGNAAHTTLWKRFDSNRLARAMDMG